MSFNLLGIGFQIFTVQLDRTNFWSRNYILAHCRSTRSTRDVNITLYIIKLLYADNEFILEVTLMQDFWLVQRIWKSRTNIVLTTSKIEDEVIRT